MPQGLLHDFRRHAAGRAKQGKRAAYCCKHAEDMKYRDAGGTPTDKELEKQGSHLNGCCQIYGSRRADIETDTADWPRLLTCKRFVPIALEDPSARPIINVK